MSRTQETEKFYFDKFVQAYNIQNASYEHSDKPDMRCNISGKNIGIEITTFHLKNGSDISSEQRQSRIREKVIQKAQSLYEKENGKNIEVSFDFGTIEDEAGLACRISNWLSRQSLTTSGHLPLNSFEEIPELRFVYVNLGPYEDATWRNVQSYSIENTSPTALQNIINSKEEKYDGYGQCDETWLLIVIDFINFGMDQEPSNVDYSKIRISKFDKVILYKTGYDTVIELPKTPPQQLL